MMPPTAPTLHDPSPRDRGPAARPAVWLWLTLLAALLGACGTEAATLNGTVLKVLDGDSLIVRVAGREREVRLAQIDAPERGQPHGEASKDILRRLVLDRAVTLQVSEQDRYGRDLAWLRTSDIEVNTRLVELGAAWVYRRYASDPRLPRLEDAARAARRGLWAMPAAERIPPWEWRQNARSAREARDPPPSPAAGLVLGNRRSRVYHLPHCPNYDDISPANREPFASARAAEAAGYRRARNCAP